MRRNKLYTVNQWNKPLFLENNKFLFGGDTWENLSKNAGMSVEDYKNSKNIFGLSKIDNPFSKGNIGTTASALAPMAANIVGEFANSAISNGLSSKAGGAVSDIGGMVGGAVGMANPVIGSAISLGSKVVGGLINAGWGTDTDEAALQAANQGTDYYNNFNSNATSFEDVKGPLSQTNVQDAYRGGWFTSDDADEKNEELRRKRAIAEQRAYASVKNNVSNIAQTQMNNMLANYAAFGGLFHKFDDGGNKAAFLDEFGTDPIGAAIRYNQSLNRAVAEKENAQLDAAREAEYMNMQSRLANLETENQGLHALMGAQTLPPLSIDTEIPPASSPSSATHNSRGNNKTWDYIEKELRNSGKFNDVQIKGIKYNLQRESSLNPDIVGDGGAAFGLAQWHGSRKPKDMSLEGQTKHLIETLSNYDGNEHWIGRSNYDGFMNARTPEEAHYFIANGYERPHKNIIAKVKRDSDMSLSRLKAFGGELGTNGTDFTNGLLQINEGGTHEDNPLEGVPMGLDAEGVPNLVEEGETVYNDYVFSDRLLVPDFMYKELGLGGVMKKKGKGMSFADASKKLASESEQRPNDPISQAGLEASLSKLAEVQEAERMKNQAEEYKGLQYAFGGKKCNKFGGNENHSQKIRRTSNFDYGDKVEEPVEEIPNVYGLSYLDWLNQGSPTQEKPVVDPMQQIAASRGTVVTDNGTNFKAPATTTRGGATGYDSPVIPAYSGGASEEPSPYPTWMRYAPVVGNGLMALTDAFGLTNKPDYTYADKLEAAAHRAGFAPNIKYNPIGDYMVYNPLDRMFYANQLQANARATDRAITNNALSATSKNAALLANSYNTNTALGNLYRQAEEYNLGQREKVADFNRKTNMFNSQMDLEAAMANARYAQQAKNYEMSGLAQAAALRDDIDKRSSAAKSANLNNLFTSLGNIGRENFALNQIMSSRAANNGYYTTASGKIKHSKGGKMCKK